MKLKNILIVVEDIERSKSFYKELFGLQVAADLGGNVILTEGLVLQEKALWQEAIGKDIVSGGNDMELYFEENNLDIFLEKLEKSSFPVEYVNKPAENAEYAEHTRERRVIRIYDPDHHVIEVGENRETAEKSETAENREWRGHRRKESLSSQSPSLRGRAKR